MIEFLSSWAKGLGMAIVIISILEMLLPNNKTKKYIRMVMGIYLLFTIISPFIENKDIIKLDNIDFENYVEASTTTKLNQTSMNNRIKELYIEELEKDITKKIEKKGYEVTKCKVNATIADNEKETKISKIKLNIEKSENQNNNKEENNEEINNSISLENTIVTQIQKIKPVDTKVDIEKNETDSEKNNYKENKIENDSKVTKADIQNVKKFLIEEYEVNEKCLEIN